MNHRLVALLMTVALAALPTMARAQTASTDLREMVRTYAAEHEFSGTVLVERGDQRLAFESFGLAERSFGTPVANDTRYRIASITKLFTATLIMQLVDSGQIDPQASVRTYLPDYAGDPAITVHALLNHTSGLVNPDEGADPGRGVPLYQLPHTPEQLVAEFASAPSAHAVGSHFDYSNADYFVLGRIIEAVTGQRSRRR